MAKSDPDKATDKATPIDKDAATAWNKLGLPARYMAGILAGTDGMTSAEFEANRQQSEYRASNGVYEQLSSSGLTEGSNDTIRIKANLKASVLALAGKTS